MAKTLYIVTRSDGSYDDHHTTIVGVFDSNDKAQLVIDKITKQIDKYRDKPCPFEGDLDFESFTDKQNEIYESWSNNRNEAYDFNGCYIHEHKLNKELK